MRIRIIFGISLAANLILAVAFIYRPTRVELKVVNASAQSASVTDTHSLPKIVSPPVVTDTNAPSWLSWLDQLRAAGVPDKVLAGLVVSDFEDRWERAQHEMQKRFDNGDLDADALARFMDDHDAEQEKELQLALGADGFLKWDKNKTLSDLEGKVQLSSSEADALYQLRKDLAQKQRDLAKAHSNGEIDEADFDDAQAASQKEYDDKLKTLLGDDRYAAATQPSDGVKGDLVRNLKSLNATDAQFEAVLAAQKKWNDERSKLDQEIAENGDDSDQDRIRAIDAARDAEYQRVLGTNGFDAFQKAQDSRYQTLQRYASAWQLTDDNVDYVYRALQYTQKSIQDYQNRAHALETQGQPVDWDKVDVNVQSFSQQMQQELRSYLGSDTFEKLNKNGVFETTDSE